MDINAVNTFLVYFFLILFSVAIHELGHYVFLRIGNVAIEDFSIGFGKALFQKGIFRIRLIQLGGYVRPNHYQLTRLRVTNPTIYLLSMSGGLLVNIFVGISAMVVLYHYYGNEQMLTLKQLLLHDFLHSSDQINLGQQTNTISKLLFQLAQVNISIFIANCIPFVMFDGYKIASFFSYPILKKNNLTKQKDYVELAGLILYWIGGIALSKIFI